MTTEEDKWTMGMEEVQVYLSKCGFKCASRRSFYRRLKELKIPFKVINPGGKKLNRRFRKSDIEKLVEDPEYFIRLEKEE